MVAVRPLEITNQRVVEAAWLGNGRDWGSYRSGPHRIVFHTTETTGLPSYNAGAYCPHLTYSPAKRSFTQHLPLDRTAGAMRNEAGGVQTNGDSALQVEIICYSDVATADKVGGLRADKLTDEHYADLAALTAGLGRTYAVPMIVYPQKITDGRCAGVDSPCRMTNQEWDLRQLLDGSPWGICGHRNVPENTHWDPGAVDLARIATEAFRLLAPPAAPGQLFDDVPPTHWAYEDVQYLAGLGIVKGEGPRRFDPDGTTTRAEVATLIARAIRLVRSNP